MQIQKVYKTEDNQILIVTAHNNGTGKDNRYVSVTGHVIIPMTYEDAVSQSRESLEDGECWRMAVAAEKTELSLEEWIEMVLNVDGEISQVDNSLYSKIQTIAGIDYIWDSGSCGCLHDEIKKATNEFDELIDLHLSKALNTAEKMMTAIGSDNVDEKVIEYTREIEKI